MMIMIVELFLIKFFLFLFYYFYFFFFPFFKSLKKTFFFFGQVFDVSECFSFQLLLAAHYCLPWNYSIAKVLDIVIYFYNQTYIRCHIISYTPPYIYIYMYLSLNPTTFNFWLLSMVIISITISSLCNYLIF